MSPAVVLLSALMVAAAGADALRSIATPFAAAGEGFVVFTATATPGDPIAPFEADSAPVAPCTLPGPPTILAAEVSVVVPAPALTAPARVIEPEVVLSVTFPPPDSLTPVTLRPPALVNSTFPLAVLAALRAPTVFAPASVVPPEDEG